MAWIAPAESRRGAEQLRRDLDAYKRLRSGLRQLPTPHGFSEAIMGLRAIVRVRRSEGMGLEEPLRLMHWLAAAQSFCIPHALRLHEPGYNVFEATPEHEINSMTLGWNDVGCNRLDSLTKTDRKAMIELWGEPKKHTTAHFIYQHLWEAIETKLIGERAVRAGLTAASYIELQKSIFAEIGREDEERRRCMETERSACSQASDRAARLVANPIFLDLETTGLSPGVDEVVEIGIVENLGHVLFECLIKPERMQSWPEAESIHGISPADVHQAARLRDVEGTLVKLIAGRLVVIYNAAFDVGFLPQSVLNSAGAFACAMKLYKSVQPLGPAGLADAERWAGIWRADARRHRAVADALATRLIWERIKIHCGPEFPKAVASAAIAPEAIAMRDERLHRERSRRTITIDIGRELSPAEPAAIERGVNEDSQARPLLLKWGAIAIVAVIVALFLASLI